MNSLFAKAALLVALFTGGCASRPPLETVSSVDLPRYSGKWYEIARYPNWFQRNCASDTTAEYTPNPDGSIRVINRCREKSGRIQSVEGRATIVPNSQNTRLKVGFGGPFKGDYWIIGLDEKNYSWVLVGHPSRQFLWILARERTLPDTTYQEIVALAEKRGYDPDKIMKTPQSP